MKLDDAKNQQLSSSSVLIDDGFRFVSESNFAIRFKIKTKEYIGVVFVKNSPIIKSEKNSLEVCCERIRLESGFWDENCVPFGFIPFSFYSHIGLNGQQIIAFMCDG